MASHNFSGRMMGEFVLREQIGQGGYGAVYRCEQPTRVHDDKRGRPSPAESSVDHLTNPLDRSTAARAKAYESLP
jgi:hypothetical protein